MQDIDHEDNMHLRDLLTPWEIKQLRMGMRDKRKELINEHAAAPMNVLTDTQQVAKIDQFTRLIAKLGC